MSDFETDPHSARQERNLAREASNWRIKLRQAEKTIDTLNEKIAELTTAAEPQSTSGDGQEPPAEGETARAGHRSPAYRRVLALIVKEGGRV